jgi:glyoxylate/hydroxypyruvate reductase A
MDILFYGYGDAATSWLEHLATLLPEARLRIWMPGDNARADYAVVRNPPPEMLGPREGLKAVFNLGAGVDAILTTLADERARLPAHVKLIKLDDAGMAPQMIEYVAHAVLHHARRADDYARLQADRRWEPLVASNAQGMTVGVMGLGMLGTRVAQALTGLGFAVRGWSRTSKQIDGMRTYAGVSELNEFLAGSQVLVNLLPLTPDTAGILDRKLFFKLPQGAYVINVARGAHLVDEDLLEAIRCGHLAGAKLDVFRQEPLPPGHPFWSETRISITPHVSALTLKEESLIQIAEKIRALETGRPVSGIIDRSRGY